MRPLPRRPSSTLGATAALLGVTAIWGSTFVVVKDAIARMPVMDFLAWRFGIATVAVVVLAPRSLRRLDPRGRRVGVALGLALGAGYVLQTLGLRTTPAAVSGFITGMFVVFTPLISGVALRRRVGGSAWVAVVLATGGLALLSLRGLSVGVGELLTLGCAAAYAVHIVGLGEESASYDAVGLAALQLATVTVLSALGGAPGGLAPPPDAGVWGAVLLTGLAATALAFFTQTWAQAHLPPTRAAVVMTMEPAFAGVFGVWLGGDRLSARSWLGAALVLAAMLLVEAGPRHGAEGDVERLEV